MQYGILALENPIIAYTAHSEIKTNPKINNLFNLLLDLLNLLNSTIKNAIHNTAIYISLKNLGVTEITAIINIANIGGKLEENVFLLNPNE